jgi:hypothetical protein
VYQGIIERTFEILQNLSTVPYQNFEGEKIESVEPEKKKSSWTSQT